MIKKYCDMCKKEIDRLSICMRESCGETTLDLDLCEECKKKFIEFRLKLRKKYDALHERTTADELKEMYDFLGIEFMGYPEKRVTELEED